MLRFRFSNLFFMLLFITSFSFSDGVTEKQEKHLNNFQTFKIIKLDNTSRKIMLHYLFF